MSNVFASMPDINTKAPVRLAPRVVEQEILDLFPGSVAPREFPAADDLIAKIERTPNPQEALLDLAVEHPDERVAIAAITRWQERIGKKYGRAFYMRGMHTAAAERILWHPLLDALARHQCWPKPNDMNGTIVKFKEPIDQLEALADWLASQTDPDAIAPLLEFESFEARYTLGAYAGTMTNELAKHLPLFALTQNRRLPEPLVDWAMEEAIQILTDPQKHAKTTNVIAHWGLHNARSYAQMALSGFARSGLFVSQDYIARLASEIRGEQMDLFTTENTMAPSRQKSEHAEKRQHALLSAVGDLDWNTCQRLMDELATAPTKIFVEVFKTLVRKGGVHVVAIITGESSVNARQRFWRDRVRRDHMNELVEGVLESRNSTAVLRLLTYPPTAKDRRIHEYILNISFLPDFAHAYANLITHAQGETRRRVFEKLADMIPNRNQFDFFFQNLERLHPVGFATLRTEDFLPFFESENPSVRMQAILLADRIKEITQKSAKAVDPSQSPQTRAPAPRG